MSSRRCDPPTRTLCTLLLAAFPALTGAQNTGLSEAPAMQQRIREQRQLGNAEDAWNLEQELLRLAVDNPDDVRSAWVIRDVGDHRIDVLARYDTGAVPPEIALGCYYSNTSDFGTIAQRGSQSLSAGPGRNAGSNTCATGSRRTARLALLNEAMLLYVEASRIVLRSGDVASDEARELFMKLLDTGYRSANYSVGRQSLDALLSLQEANSESWRTRAETLAFIGDWDLLFAEHFGTKYIDSATIAYEQALALLAEHDAPEETVESIFSPQTPVLLPAFTTNRLMSPQTDGSTGHIDVEFEIRDSGRSARISVLDSSVNASRDATRDLTNTIKQGRFRPIVENGRILESALVTVRYYIDD